MPPETLHTHWLGKGQLHLTGEPSCTHQEGREPRKTGQTWFGHWFPKCRAPTHPALPHPAALIPHLLSEALQVCSPLGPFQRCSISTLPGKLLHSPSCPRLFSALVLPLLPHCCSLLLGPLPPPYSGSVPWLLGPAWSILKGLCSGPPRPVNAFCVACPHQCRKDHASCSILAAGICPVGGTTFSPRS